MFVWFGLLKVASASAVGGLVATAVPFLDSSWFVPVLGALEAYGHKPDPKIVPDPNVPA